MSSGYAPIKSDVQDQFRSLRLPQRTLNCFPAYSAQISSRFAFVTTSAIWYVCAYVWFPLARGACRRKRLRQPSGVLRQLLTVAVPDRMMCTRYLGGEHPLELLKTILHVCSQCQENRLNNKKDRGPRIALTLIVGTTMVVSAAKF